MIDHSPVTAEVQHCPQTQYQTKESLCCYGEKEKRREIASNLVSGPPASILNEHSEFKAVRRRGDRQSKHVGVCDRGWKEEVGAGISILERTLYIIHCEDYYKTLQCTSKRYLR